MLHRSTRWRVHCPLPKSNCGRLRGDPGRQRMVSIRNPMQPSFIQLLPQWPLHRKTWLHHHWHNLIETPHWNRDNFYPHPRPWKFHWLIYCSRTITLSCVQFEPYVAHNLGIIIELNPVDWPNNICPSSIFHDSYRLLWKTWIFFSFETGFRRGRYSEEELNWYLFQTAIELQYTEPSRI